MSRLQKTLLAASVSLLGFNGCGSPDLPDTETAETVSTRQGVEVATAIPLPIPACSLLPDMDGDAVCDMVELVLGTNPNNPDTDGDRLNDYAESFGFGGGLDLTALGANARRGGLRRHQGEVLRRAPRALLPLHAVREPVQRRQLQRHLARHPRA